MARTSHKFDLVVLGGGTAGLSALKEARQYTDNVALIDDNVLGGNTCARVGCMPSKALIHAAKLYDDRKKMPQAGIEGSEQLYPNIPKILEEVRRKRDGFVSHMDDEISQFDSYVIKGKGSFETEDKIRVNGRLIHTENTIVATGSSPHIPKPYDKYKEFVITTDTLFERQDLPKRIAVVGLGAIGLEMAQAFAMLGVEVTAIHNDDRIGMIQDQEINDTIFKALAEDMKVWQNCTPQIRKVKTGLLLSHDSHETEVDALFIATGRTPNTRQLGFKKLDIDTNGHGVPPFNRYSMRLPGRSIYMAGDVTDERAILHEAIDEGRRAAYHALHENASHLPRYANLQIVFTKPVIAVVGDTAYALRHDSTEIGEASFENQGRAVIEQKNKGKIRLFADKEGGYFRGAEIMAPAAEHLAHFLALALTRRLTVDQLLETPFYHPALEEGLKTALQDVQKKVRAK